MAGFLALVGIVFGTLFLLVIMTMNSVTQNLVLVAGLVTVGAFTIITLAALKYLKRG